MWLRKQCTLRVHNIKIFIVSDLLPLKSLISFERIRTIKSGNTQELKAKANRKKCINIKYAKKKTLQTKKQCKCSSYYYHATYCTKRFRDKVYIKTDTLSKCSDTLKNSPQWESENILYPSDSKFISQVFLKTVYFLPQGLWNDGASAYLY